MVGSHQVRSEQTPQKGRMFVPSEVPLLRKGVTRSIEAKSKATGLSPEDQQP